MRFLLGNSTGVTASDDNTSWVGDDKKDQDKYHSDIPDGERYAETCVLSLMALIGTIGNALVCLTIITQKPLRQHPFHKLKLVSLSLSDLLVCACIMPQTAFTVFKSRWEFSQQLCTFTGFGNMVCLVCSVMSLGLISFNRYMKICRSHLHTRIYTNRNIALMALGVWCLSAMLATPPLVGWAEYDYLPRQSFCFCKWTTSVSYTFFMVIVCFGGPFGMMTLCYVPIFKSFKQVHQRLKQKQEKKGVTGQKGHGPFRVIVKEGDDMSEGTSVISSTIYSVSEPTSSALDISQGIQAGSSVKNTFLSRTPSMTKEAIIPIGPPQNSATSACLHVPTSPKQSTSVTASTPQQKNATPSQSTVRVSSKQEGTASRVCMLEKQAISTGPSTKADVHEEHTAYVGSAVQEELPFANPATESGAVAHGQCHAYSLGGMERFGTDLSDSPVDLNKSTMLHGGNEGLQTTVSDTLCMNSDVEAALPAPSTKLTPGNMTNVGLVPPSLNQYAVNAHTDSGEGRHNYHVQAVASEKKPLDAKAGTSESCPLAPHSGDGLTAVPIRPTVFKIIRKKISRLAKRLRWKSDRSDVQLAKTLMVVIVAFVLCWMPFCITMFLSVFAPHTLTRPPAMFTLLLGYSNSCLNPILYSLTDRQMKKGYRNLFTITYRRIAQIAPS